MKHDSLSPHDRMKEFPLGRRQRRPVPSIQDIHARISGALKRAGFGANAINVVTEGSTVRLGGRVSVWREREIAVRAAWAVRGVTNIIDNILVR